MVYGNSFVLKRLVTNVDRGTKLIGGILQRNGALGNHNHMRRGRGGGGSGRGVGVRWFSLTFSVS